MADGSTPKNDTDELIIAADSLLSLIYYRERNGLSEQTMSELPPLLAQLRKASDAMIRERQAGGASERTPKQ